MTLMGWLLLGLFITAIGVGVTLLVMRVLDYRPTQFPTGPKYTVKLETTPSPNGWTWLLVVGKNHGSGYWSRVPQPYHVFGANGELLASGTWTYDFRFEDNHTVASAESPLHPARATVRIAGLGDIVTEDLT